MDFSKALERDQQRKREYAMYGCYEDELRANIESSVTFKFTGAAMVAASMMSDAQELLSMSGSEGTREEVRQMLNRAKFALFEYVVTE